MSIVFVRMLGVSNISYVHSQIYRYTALKMDIAVVLIMGISRKRENWQKEVNEIKVGEGVLHSTEALSRVMTSTDVLGRMLLTLPRQLVLHKIPRLIIHVTPIKTNCTTKCAPLVLNIGNSPPTYDGYYNTYRVSHSGQSKETRTQYFLFSICFIFLGVNKLQLNVYIIIVRTLSAIKTCLLFINQ